MYLWRQLISHATGYLTVPSPDCNVCGRTSATHVILPDLPKLFKRPACAGPLRLEFLLVL